MSSYQQGDIVLVHFPFTDLTSAKLRPALVVSSVGEDLIIVGIFSRIPGAFKATWVLIDEKSSYFPGTGLKKTSLLKAEKLL
jgi:mRNA interferase MazF